MRFSSVSPGTYLHHDEEHVVLLLGRRDRHDVRVVEAREQAWLPEQLAEVEILPVGHLDRDLLVDPGVFREVDAPEAAAPERREDLVLPEDLSEKQHEGECEYRSKLEPKMAED